MVHSMTGFGRGEAENEKIAFTVEIKTVNHRYMEPTIRLSRRFAALEQDVRTALTRNIARGKVDVSINYKELESSAQITLHEDVLGRYLELLRTGASKYGLEDDLKISHILALPDVIETTQDEADMEMIRPVLMEAVQTALDRLNAMRAEEGARIVNDLLEKADGIGRIVASLEEGAPQIEEKYRAKLTEHIQDILDRMNSGSLVDQGILENEVALYADRVCVDEEMVRLKSHIEELKKLLASGEPVGRQLDFLLQEFNREANTIASKAGDLSVTQQALALKKEIEKVREQIQNLE